MLSKTHVQMQVNGEQTELLCSPWHSLLETLREVVGLTGALE